MTPNICICGTPGTGKTSLSEELVKRNPRLLHVDLSAIIKEKGFYDEWDDKFNCSIMNEKRVKKYVKDLLKQRPEGGLIVDFHTIGFLQSKWFEYFIVLRSDIQVLSKRLEKRGYDNSKIQENVESEIFQVCVDEVADMLAERDDNSLIELSNNTIEDQETNLLKILDFLE